MSRWRRQQRKRANRRRAADAADKAFGDFMTDFATKFDRSVKEFGAAMVHACGEFAKWAAQRRMQATLDRAEEGRECP